VEKRLVGSGLTGAARLGFDFVPAKESLRLGIRPAVVVKVWRRAGSAVAWPLLFGNLSVFFRESTASRQIFLAGELAAGGGSL
jgi:hypothetical protein